ncbi:MULTISPECIES: hypothetical protein [unclassified Microcoleus]|uniref:hypothetical protein n=1 Tax=unclassified Microcoleus TaxID=2642155 RepID=UPI002FD689F0
MFDFNLKICATLILHPKIINSMSRRYTWQQLEARAAKIKAREAFMEAKKKAPVATAYKAEGDKSTLWAYSFEDDKVIVPIPLLAATKTKITAGIAALGLLESTAADLVAGVTRLNFKEGHKQVLRITVHEAKATPLPKNTPWGTRVVDMIDNSYSFPFSLGNDGTPTMKEAKAAFQIIMKGALATLLAKKGSIAVLSFKGKKIDIVRP